MEEKGGANDYAVYEAMREAADVVLAFAKSAGILIDDKRAESVNPFYFPTRKGLFLQCYRSMPIALWTPWGEWGFGGDFYGCGTPRERARLLEKVLSAITTTLYIEETETLETGLFGPVYAVHEVRGKSGVIELAVPELYPFDFRLTREERWKLLGIWNSFAARYDSR